MAEPVQPGQDQQAVDRIVVTGNQRGGRFGINEFRSEINLNGILQPNRFLVVFSMPRGLRTLEQEFGKPATDGMYADGQDFLIMRCESAVIPGVNFFTNDDIRRYGIGQIEKRPYLPTFNPIRLQFVVDRNARVIKFFEDWCNGIVNYNTDLGMSPAQTFNGEGVKKPYLLKYKDAFISPTVRIWVYNPHSIQTLGVKLYDAYPLATSDIDLNWGDENSAMKYSVVLQFTHKSMQFTNHNGDPFEFSALERFGITPKSDSEVIDDSLNEYKNPSLLGSIFKQTEQIIQGEIYSGAERAITKAFDKIFK